jgi:hypothetical protein
MSDPCSCNDDGPSTDHLLEWAREGCPIRHQWEAPEDIILGAAIQFITHRISLRDDLFELIMYIDLFAEEITLKNRSRMYPACNQLQALNIRLGVS